MIQTIPTICGSIAGRPSPLGVKLHDAGYKALNLDFKYLAVGTDNLGAAVGVFRSVNAKGFGVSMPFKQEIIPMLDNVSEDVRVIGACNTVTITSNGLSGFNTDWVGALTAIDECGVGTFDRAVIVGDGGVARAIAFGLKSRGIRVFIASRNEQRRTAMIRDIRLDGGCDLSHQGMFDAKLVVNATPVSELESCPLDLARHPSASAVLDVVFGRKETPLVARARSMGLRVAPGWRMLLHQATRQFELYTGQTAPIDAMSEVLSAAFQ